MIGEASLIHALNELTRAVQENTKVEREQSTKLDIVATALNKLTDDEPPSLESEVAGSSTAG